MDWKSNLDNRVVVWYGYVMTTRVHKPPTDSEYRRWYERGWRYSSSAPQGGLDYGDSMGAPDAWYDGYLDADGRDKWHTYYCRQTGGCEEHQWGKRQ